MAVFTRGLGWSKEQTEVFLAGVRKDMKNTKIHCYWEMYTPTPSILVDADVSADTTLLDKSHYKVSEHCRYITEAIRVGLGTLGLR